MTITGMVQYPRVEALPDSLIAKFLNYLNDIAPREPHGLTVTSNDIHRNNNKILIAG